MVRILLMSILSLWTLNMFAQTDLCSGDRLVEPIFSDVQITESIKFDEGNNIFNVDVDLVMDIYEPVGDDLERRPVIVMAHGGSFITGDRKNPVMVNTCTELAKRGYVAASIEYSLFPALVLGAPDSAGLINIITQAMGELKSAVRFLREDGLGDNVYGVDPTLISVGGYSAGAILACHQGMLDDSDVIPAFVQTAIDAQGGFDNLGNRLETSDEVLTVFNIAGSVYDLDFIDEDSAPIYSAHGNADETVPYEFGLTGGIMTSNGSANIQSRYNSLNLDNVLFTFEGGGHTNIFTAAQFEADLLQMYDDFFLWNKDQVCNFLLSSNEELATTQVSIYPNPTDGELNFKLPEDVSSSYTVEVFNQIGQLIYSSPSFNTPTAQINIAGLSNGLYLAKIDFEENYQPITRRIVVGQ